MSTISDVTIRHLAFQETQFLPLLAEETITRPRPATAPRAVQPRSVSSSDKTARHLAFKKTQLLPLLSPEIKARQGGASRAPAPESKKGFAGQVFSAILKLSACCAMLNLWGGRLHG